MAWRRSGVQFPVDPRNAVGHRPGVASFCEALGIGDANFGRATADEHTAWPDSFNPNFRIPDNGVD